jgi:hypothetical protein
LNRYGKRIIYYILVCFIFLSSIVVSVKAEEPITEGADVVDRREEAVAVLDEGDENGIYDHNVNITSLGLYAGITINRSDPSGYHSEFGAITLANGPNSTCPAWGIRLDEFRLVLNEISHQELRDSSFVVLVQELNGGENDPHHEKGGAEDDGDPLMGEFLLMLPNIPHASSRREKRLQTTWRSDAGVRSPDSISKPRRTGIWARPWASLILRPRQKSRVPDLPFTGNWERSWREP